MANGLQITETSSLSLNIVGFTITSSVCSFTTPVKLLAQRPLRAELAIRYVPFNLEALLDVALKAAGADECISFEKVQDGASRLPPIFISLY